MSVVSASRAKWAVSSRTTGEVLAAAAHGPNIEVALLGVPAGFSLPEAEAWLADLIGVAAETSARDASTRAIPPLLHHTLTGMLFTHAELWAPGAVQAPCSLAFVTSPDGPAFGWVGDPNLIVNVNGRVIEPIWVRVRDEAGREAFATSFSPGDQIEVQLDWGGHEGSPPIVFMQASYSRPRIAPVIPAVLVGTQPAAPSARVAVAPEVPEPPPPATIAAPSAGLPESLPLDRPSLAGPVELAPQRDWRFPLEAHPAPTKQVPVFDPHGVEPVAVEREEVVRIPVLPSLATPRVEPPADAPASAAPALVVPPVAPPLPEGESAPPAGAPPPVTVGAWEPVVLTEPAQEPDPLPPSVSEPPAPGEPHPVQRWLARLLRFGRPEPEARDEADAVPRPPSPIAMAPAAPVDVDDAPSPPQPDAVNADVASAPAALPGPQQGFETPVPLRVETRAPVELSREQIARLPRLSPDVPASSAAMDVTHEPVGADIDFAIPRVPEPGTDPIAAGESAPENPGPPPLPAPVEVGSGEAPLIIETHVGGGGAQELREIPSRVGAAAPASGAFNVPAWVRERAAQTEVESPVAVRPRAWPAADPEARRPAPDWRRLAPWAAGLLVLFTLGWWIGGWGHHETQAVSQTPRWMRALGIGGARFDATIDSWPTGALVRIDGRDIGRRTPAKVDLPPGEHTIELTMPDLGTATFTLLGRKGENLHPVYPMTGGLVVLSDDPGIPLRVSVDGRDQGFAPVELDSLAPGLHEVAFIGPGMPSWAQNVQVRVHETARVVAEPMTSPSTGMLTVQAQITDADGTASLSGGQVFIDGEPRGRTPLTIELPRGPHSVRVTWQSETAPVQVIDLPGGNQRYATFNLGLGSGAPELTVLHAPRDVGVGRDNSVNVRLTQLTPGDVREAWMHVRGDDGVWRRYALTATRAARGVTLSGAHPGGVEPGTSRWYMSVITVQGDEFYSEMQQSRVLAP